MHPCRPFRRECKCDARASRDKGLPNSAQPKQLKICFQPSIKSGIWNHFAQCQGAAEQQSSRCKKKKKKVPRSHTAGALCVGCTAEPRSRAVLYLRAGGQNSSVPIIPRLRYCRRHLPSRRLRVMLYKQPIWTGVKI